MFALHIENLNYRYRSDFLLKQFHALKNLSLDIKKGEAFGFLGHNGAGKTTTIKCILGLIRPSSGSITILGEPASNLEARTKTGYLPEQPYFYDHLRVGELMGMYAALAGVNEGRERRIDECLERVGMATRKQALMRSLSKGLTQRVALAQALIGNPELLILDEPFSGLDPIGRREFRDIFFDLKDGGTTLFMSSHILGDIEDLCDRISILSKGELKGVFSLSEISKQTEPRFELVVGANGSLPELEALSQTITIRGSQVHYEFDSEQDALQALGIAKDKTLQIERFERRGSTLEELFVRMIAEDGGGYAK